MAIEAVAITLLTSAAGKVFSELETMMGLKKHNQTLIRDIEEFQKSLHADLRMVEQKRQTLRDDQFWAIESLKKDLEDARRYLEQCRTQGRFTGLWTAQKITSELMALRNRLSHNFQVKLFFTNLEVLIDKRKLTDDIQSKLSELLTRSANRSDIDSSTNDIKTLLKPLTLGQKVQDRKIEELRADIRTLSGASGSDHTSPSDTEKFLGDILDNLAVVVPSFHGNEEDMEYYDMYTAELMYDPVKCSDCRTYDRFSVFRHNKAIQTRPLVILCDDLDVRSRLFQKFSHEQPEYLMHSRRTAYRTEAVATAKADDFGEALERLNNVLQWDPCDSECLRERDRMRDIYRKEALRLPVENGNYSEILDILQNVQKWWPSDREVFDRIEIISRQQPGTSYGGNYSQTGVQPQLRMHEAPAHMRPMDRNAEASSVRGDHDRDRDRGAASATGPSYRYRADASTTLNNGDSHRLPGRLQPWEAAGRPKPPQPHGLFLGDTGYVTERVERPVADSTSPWWEQEYFGYLACLLCRCKACDSQMFGEEIKGDDKCLNFACCAMSPCLGCIYAFDFATSICAGVLFDYDMDRDGYWFESSLKEKYERICRADPKAQQK